MLDRTSLVITILGAINWLLVGLFQFDLVAYLCGGQAAVVSRVIYTIVGIAGLWCISLPLPRASRRPRGRVSFSASASGATPAGSAFFRPQCPCRGTFSHLQTSKKRRLKRKNSALPFARLQTPPNVLKYFCGGVRMAGEEVLARARLRDADAVPDAGHGRRAGRGPRGDHFAVDQRLCLHTAPARARTARSSARCARERACSTSAAAAAWPMSARQAASRAMSTPATWKRSATQAPATSYYVQSSSLAVYNSPSTSSSRSTTPAQGLPPAAGGRQRQLGQDPLAGRRAGLRAAGRPAPRHDLSGANRRAGKQRSPLISWIRAIFAFAGLVGR